MPCGEASMKKTFFISLSTLIILGSCSSYKDYSNSLRLSLCSQSCLPRKYKVLTESGKEERYFCECFEDNQQ